MHPMQPTVIIALLLFFGLGRSRASGLVEIAPKVTGFSSSD
jgi:hypothetical protein